ncbi:MAG TPA: ABC transporter substrate-binding protein [Acidimicrobiales bacterium]|jgi:branched-chain amino acid transport system substrate-binding protein
MVSTVMRGSITSRFMCLGLGLCLGVPGLLAADTPSASAATSKAPIILGYIGDQTGVSASTFADGTGGAQARIDLQNAHGGVDGRKLELVAVDSTSSTSGTATAVQDLISNHHVFGIVEDSAFFFGGAKFAQQAGVPVTGYGIDGPEWLEQPNTNMFDVVPTSYTPLGGYYYGSTLLAQFFKDRGVTKAGVLGYGISPSATQGVEEAVYEDKLLGIANCDEDLSIPFGGVDFTTTVLRLKADGCNGYETLFEDASDIALGQAVKNAGVPMKAQVMSEGYDNNVLDSATARAAIDGDYFGTVINFTSPDAATETMLAALKKYDHGFTGIPDLGLYSGYLSADLMIYGLEHAGANPSQASFIKNLRQVGGYTAGGILPEPTTFEHFGTAAMLPKSSCEYFVQLKGSKFVVVNGGKPVCGKSVKIPPSALKS